MSDFNPDNDYSLDEQLSILTDEESTTTRKVAVIRFIFHNVYETGELFESFAKENLTSVFPEVVVIHQSVLQTNLEIMHHHSKRKTLDDSVLDDIQESLKESINILTIISDFLTYIASKGTLNVILYCFIPININNLVYSTISYCKLNQEMYINQCDKIPILHNLLKSAIVIHQKMLTMIETQFVFDTTLNTHEEFLAQLFDGLCNTSNILYGLNIKVMTTTWRCYGNLIKQHGVNLTHFEINKPLITLFEQISSLITGVIQVESPDVQNFKISNFLLRIVTVVIHTFWKECSKQAKTIFGSIADIYRVTCQGSDHPQNAILCNEHIHAQLDMILLRFLIDPGVLIIKDLQDRDDCQGFVIVVKHVMHRAKIFKTRGAVCSVFKLFLEYLKTRSLFNRKGCINRSDYKEFLVGFASAILGVSEPEYYDIEEVLILNIIENEAESSSFASDVWHLILISSPPTLSFNILTSLADRLKSGHSLPTLSFRHNLPIFLRHCFQRLPAALKARWIEKYPAETHLNLWALFCIGEVAPSGRKHLAEVVARNVCTRFGCDRMTPDDLQYVMDGLQVLSSMSLSKDLIPPETQTKLNTTIITLFSTDSVLLRNNVYIHNLANAVLPCAISFIINARFQSAHLSKILNSLTNDEKENYQAIKQLSTFKVLTAISKTAPNEYNALTLSAVGKCLNLNQHNATFSSFTSGDPESQIVNLYANATRAAFECQEVWMKNLVNVCPAQSNNDHLTAANLSENENKDVDVEAKNEEPPVKKVKLQKPRGRFMNVPFRPVAISQGAQRPEDEAQDILDNMKDEVRRLQKLARSGKWERFSKENSQDVFHVVSKLQQFMYGN